MQKLAVVSLVLGVVSVLAELYGRIPVGLFMPVPIIGLVLGIAARKPPRKRIATMGASLCGLVLLYYVIGFLLFALFP